MKIMKTLYLILFILFILGTLLNWIVAIWTYPPSRWDCIIIGFASYFIAIGFRKNFIGLKLRR